MKLPAVFHWVKHNKVPAEAATTGRACFIEGELRPQVDITTHHFLNCGVDRPDFLQWIERLLAIGSDYGPVEVQR